MRYVRKVISNIKGGVTAELGPRTLIIGPNGSGKSRIVNSVEYALTAAVSDVVGRVVVKDVHQILTLGPGAPVAAMAVIADSKDPEGSSPNLEEVSCEVVGKRSSTPRYPDAFPLREMKEMLAGGAETVRKYFLRMVSGGLSLESIREQNIPRPLVDLFDASIAGTPISTPAGDILLRAVESAKVRERELNSQAKAAETTIQMITQGATSPPSGQLLTTAKESAVKSRQRLEELTAELRHVQEIGRVVARADGLASRRAELVERLLQIPAPSEADEVREHLSKVLEYAEKHALGACPACKTPNPALWTDRLISIKAKIVERGQELGQYQALAAELRQVSTEHSALEAQIAVSTLGSTLRAPSEVEGLLLETRKEEAEATSLVIQYERAQEAWEQVKRQRDAIADLGLQAQRWGLLVTELKRAIGELLDQSTVKFAARVQKFLPAEDHFHLELHDGDREVCRYGFMRELEDWKEFHTALSGAEWARLTVALTAAAIPDEDDSVRVIVPDDRSWDPDTLSTVMAALSAAPAQVILATTTEPTAIPKGWTVIHPGQPPDLRRPRIRMGEEPATVKASTEAPAKGKRKAPAKGPGKPKPVDLD